MELQSCVKFDNITSTNTWSQTKLGSSRNTVCLGNGLGMANVIKLIIIQISDKSQSLSEKSRNKMCYICIR